MTTLTGGGFAGLRTNRATARSTGLRCRRRGALVRARGGGAARTEGCFGGRPPRAFRVEPAAVMILLALGACAEAGAEADAVTRWPRASTSPRGGGEAAAGVETVPGVAEVVAGAGDAAGVAGCEGAGVAGDVRGGSSVSGST